jgi:hypothetical protein
MSPLLRTSTILLGVFFGLQGVAWLLAPARAAAGLDMPLLDGAARSTQIGDLGAFFLVAAACMVLGARRGDATLLRVAAGLFASAAAGRTIAWALHGAPFAAFFIVVEVAMTWLLVTAARRTGDAAGAATA